MWTAGQKRTYSSYITVPARGPFRVSIVTCPAGVALTIGYDTPDLASVAKRLADPVEEVDSMGCLLALLARIGLLVVWLQTPLVKNGFHGGWILPLLGIIFLPLTTIAYVVVYALGNGSVTGAAWLWVVLGLLFDLGLHSSGFSSNRHRVRRYRGYQSASQ